jgi:hypothetical protein
VKETWKERTEREIKEKFMEMRGGPEVDDISVRFEKLRTDYHAKCDEVVALREKLAQIEDASKSKSGISLHDKEDGIWLGIHASSTGRSAIVLLETHGWGRLVKQTFEDYFSETPHSGPAATRST